MSTPTIYTLLRTNHNKTVTKVARTTVEGQINRVLRKKGLSRKPDRTGTHTDGGKWNEWRTEDGLVYTLYIDKGKF